LGEDSSPVRQGLERLKEECNLQIGPEHVEKTVNVLADELEVSDESEQLREKLCASREQTRNLRRN